MGLTDSSSAVGAAIQGAMDIGSNALQNRYTKQQMKLQNRMNIDMWNRQNAYNTPEAQMKRFSDAGLNPNLIYGQGNSGNAGAPPTLEAPFRKAPHLDALSKMAQIIALENAKAQGELIRSQKQAMDEKVFETKSRTALNAANRGLSLMRNEFLSHEDRSKFGPSNVDENLKEIYTTQRVAARLRNEVLEAQLANMGVERALKSENIREMRYLNNQRDFLGVEKTDNILWRGGLSLYRKGQEFLNQGPSFKSLWQQLRYPK